MLQASNDMWVPVFEPHDLEWRSQHGSRRGLRHVEQRPEAAVLQLRIVQGRAAGELEAGVEEGEHNTDRDGGGSDLGVPHCLQRLQECSNGRALPQIQTGMGLMS